MSLPPNVCEQTLSFINMDIVFSITITKDSFLNDTNINALNQAFFTHKYRRRQWHPTPVLLPGKSHGRWSLVAAVHEVAKSRTRLSDFTFTFHFHALEKEMATHSSVLAWRIPGTGKPCGLPSVGSHRVGHDWSDLAAAAVLRIKDSHDLIILLVGVYSSNIFPYVCKDE